MLVASLFVKVRVFVPVTAAKAVREAVGEAGAGVQGHYDFCSATYPAVGRFRPLPGAKPAVGQVGTLEEVEEEVIEVICHQDMVEKVVTAIQAVHPYEEPAIDIMPRLEIA